jgi:hypothetical protein
MHAVPMRAPGSGVWSGDPDSTTARRLLLREEVGGLRERESRRVFDPSVHVGELGGGRTGFVLWARDDPAVDAAMRVDIASRLVADSPPGWRTAWISRPGTPEPHDRDVQWLAAVRTAFGIHDRALDGFYALTRSGWRDVLTEERQVWARLRLR